MHKGCKEYLGNEDEAVMSQFRALMHNDDRYDSILGDLYVYILLALRVTN